MRTTLTLDDDVARLVAEATHAQRRPMKQVINDALRRGLGQPAPAEQEPCTVTPHESRLRSGLDLAGFNRLSDDMEIEAVLAKAAREA